MSHYQAIEVLINDGKIFKDIISINKSNMKTIIALLLVFAVANASLETIMLRKALGKTTKVVPSDAERTGGWQSV